MEKRNENPLITFAVFSNPADAPGLYVARAFDFDRPTSLCHQAETLEECREWIFRKGICQGLIVGARLDRMPQDEPQIVEVWI